MPNQIPITSDQWLKDRQRDRLAAQVDGCNEDLERLRSENKQLLAAIRHAPHDYKCGCLNKWRDLPCNCWNHAALAGEEREVPNAS